VDFKVDTKLQEHIAFISFRAENGGSSSSETQVFIYKSTWPYKQINTNTTPVVIPYLVCGIERYEKPK
jgi:hypothetical protein